MNKKRQLRRRRTGLGGVAYGLGVVLLEAAAIAGLLWLIVIRAHDDGSSSEEYSQVSSSPSPRNGPPTLSLDRVVEWQR